MEKVALITGASTGIGRATAEKFAKEGYHLILLARRERLLNSLVKSLGQKYPCARFLSFPCDVTQWQAVLSAAVKVNEDFEHINVLINNAGSFEYLSFERSSIQKIDELVDVNLKGVIYVTKAFLPVLRKTKKLNQWAKIVNVSSVAGLWGFSHMSVYTATKFAVSGFSSGLRRELHDVGIEVGCIFPGPVDTRRHSSEKKSSDKRFLMFGNEIAEQIYKLATTWRRTHVSHPFFKLLNAIESLSPTLADSMVKRFL